MVLAAGLGTRLQPFTFQTPKALIPLLGVPCIDFSFSQLVTAGIGEVTVNVHAHPDQIKNHLKEAAREFGIKLGISDESALLLGSSGGIRKAISRIESQPGISEPFFSLNADVISNVNLTLLAHRHKELRKKEGVVMTLCLAKGKMLARQNAAYTEILVDENTGLVSGMGTKKEKSPFYTGTAVFETEAFRLLKDETPSEFVPEVLKPWVEKGKVGFFWMDDLWFDIGSPELWWKSHFEILKEYEKGLLPDFWKKQIDRGIKRGFFSAEQGIVDYDDFSGNHSGKYIRFHGVRHDL